MNHGIQISEQTTATRAMNQIESGIVVAIGTAPVASEKPVLAYTYAEFVNQLGYSDDFEKYTLCEVASAQFQLYGMCPAVFINVFDPSKHFEEVEKTFEGVTEFSLEGEAQIDTLKVTSGEKIEPTQLIKDTDFIVDKMYLHGADNDPVAAIEFLNLDKIVDGKFKVTYRMTREALGGEPTVEEVQVEELEDNIWELTDDTILESVTVESGGVDTLVELDCTVETGGGVAQVTILDAAAVVDNKISVSYKKADATLVTAADIIGGIDAATGAATGLALVDSIYPKWNLIPGILIAPKFSTDVAVITALTCKAKSISNVFSGVAICDIPTSCKTYSQAVEWKNENNLSDSHLILTYPKVLAEGKQYHLSTHLAALMNRVDYSNDSVPYQSPSNQGLEISAAVLDDGTEVFFNQSTANFMNANGIVTVFTFGNGLRAWGNYTSAYPATNDVKDIFIPVRRMFDFLSAMLLTNYISNLDVPIVRRQVDSILQSCNLYLASLTSRQMLLGGDLTFNEADNSTSDLMAGKITFRLNYCPPVPAQNIQFILEYDSSYYANLFQ